MPDYTPIQDILDLLREFQMELVGSTAINGEGEDVDIAVRMEGFTTTPTPPGATPEERARIFQQNVERLNTLRDIIQQLTRLGCTRQGGADYDTINLEADDQFTSFRRGRFNLLLCFNDNSWNRFTLGRDFCILLRDLGVDMGSKAVRVAIHGMSAHGDINMVRADLARLRVR